LFTLFNNIHSKFSFLIGIIDGRGNFHLFKTNNQYFYYSFRITLNDLELVKLIENIFDLNFIESKKNRYALINRELLLNNLFPILDNYLLLSSKKNEFLYFRQIFFSGINNYDDIPTNNFYDESYFDSISSDFTNNLNLDAWIIGYLSVIGGFNSNRLEIVITSTDIKPLEIIKNYFNLSRNINKLRNSYILNITSINDMTNFINKLNNNPIKFVGSRLIEYNNFINALKLNSKFKNIFIS
jgi:hypothetical protein